VSLPMRLPRSLTRRVPGRQPEGLPRRLLVSLTRRGVVLAAAAGLVMALVVSSHPFTPATGGTYPAAHKVLDFTPVTGATFNRPIGTFQEQRAIFTVLNNTIDATPSGATIRFAVFSFSEKTTADRLIAAHARGVNVQMIFDDHHIFPQEARLRSSLGRNPNAQSFVVYCHHSCRGVTGVMHDKMFLFSQAGQASNIVNVGSDNITRHNAVDQWSDMYTIVGDPALYFTYSGVFEQMKYDRPMASPYIAADINGYQPQFYPYPGVQEATDPVYEALSQITCVGLPPGAGGPNGNTQIRISQHAWNGDRGIYLAREVAALKQAGCNIKVIYGIGFGAVVRNILTRAGIPLSYGTHRGVHTHEKYLLVNGWFGDNPDAKVVWTGSHNWSNGSLKRDEIILRIENADAYAQYFANFKDIWVNG
jgi:phosphatidylserine/phosphatidylglycerophosphate/cardiolipin synthase-like enzyme